MFMSHQPSLGFSLVLLPFLFPALLGYCVSRVMHSGTSLVVEEFTDALPKASIPTATILRFVGNTFAE